MKRLILVCVVFSLLGAGLATRTDAEVRVRTTPDGEYDSTVIVPGGDPWQQGIWSSRTRGSLRRGSIVLNPQGDRYGDLLPAVGEPSMAPHHPFVVWSRFNGTDYDLVYSSWRYGWSAIEPVSTVTIGGDDLDPNVAFSRAGVPLVAWWNSDLEDGHGTVYYSVYSGSRWVEPVRISHATLGGRYPVFDVRHDIVVINYESDDGLVRLSYELPTFDPTTITDDIDPQGLLSDGSVSVSGKGLKNRN